MEKIWSQLLAQEATISQTLNSHLTYLSPPCCRLGSVSPAATAAYLSLGSGNVDIWQNILFFFLNIYFVHFFQFTYYISVTFIITRIKCMFSLCHCYRNSMSCFLCQMVLPHSLSLYTNYSTYCHCYSL